MARRERGERFDVVVAGAGAGGLAAALSAADGGHSVLVVDAREDFPDACNTSMTAAMVPAAGSRWQRSAGIDDSPDRFYADVIAKTRGHADPLIARALTSVAPALMEWLADDIEVPLELVTEFSYPGHSRDRCHAVPDRSGRTLHRHLLDAVAGRREIVLEAPKRLTAVELDAAEAVESGVLAVPDGHTETVAATAVVLATNGYAADPELVRRHMPEIADGLYFGGQGSTGDALRIGGTLGADIGYLDAYQGHGSVAEPHGVLVTWATVMHGAIVVNCDGERFGDETIGYSEYAAKVLGQPGRIAWVVFDGRVDRACRSFAAYRELVEAGAIRWADDVAELAEAISAGADRLGVTLETVHGAARGLAVDGFGRTAWEAPLESPYAAVKVTGALFHTQGGLMVDEEGAVLRDDEPLPGLYAVGGAAAGMSGHGGDGYLAGNGLLAALGLGYLAGRALAP